MGCADPQLLSNFLALSVTAVLLFSWISTLIPSARSAVVKFSDGPSGLHQQCLFCYLWTFPSTGTPSFTEHTFLHIVQIMICQSRRVWPQRLKSNTLLNSVWFRTLARLVSVMIAAASMNTKSKNCLSFYYALCQQERSLTKFHQIFLTASNHLTENITSNLF
jgi:hypothetical protein